MEQKARVFEDKPAIRQRVPLLIGAMGPSGGGKTYSGLRLATGIQRVTGGDIYVIDTESRRALHYADKFKFRHVEFGAPFSPLDYLIAIEHCVKKGASIVMVDSMSHEHEGPGGVLEMHEKEVERMAGGDRAKAERVNMLAWAKPKAERRRLINTLLQLNANFIFCFRAKEKIKIKPGKDPQELGWMPIAGEEFLYEMTVNCLLPPNARGVPQWQAEYAGEKSMMKLPVQFEEIFKAQKPLDESMGEAMAQWAAGGEKVKPLAEVSKELKKEKEAESLGEKALTLNLIKEFMIAKWPSQSQSDKLSKTRAIEVFFEPCTTWKQVEELELPKLQACYKRLTDELGQTPKNFN